MSGILVGAASGYKPPTGGGGGSPDIINEDFEGSGAPSHWITLGAGTVDFDYSASPLAGSQSLLMDSSVDSVSVQYLKGFALNHAEIWGKFLFKVTTLPSGFPKLIQIFDVSDSEIGAIVLTGSAHLKAYDAIGGDDVDTVDTLSTGTLYDVWYHYKSGSGTNGVLEASFDVHGNPRPNSGNKHCGFTDSHATTNATGLRSQTTVVNAGVWIIDNFQVASTDIF